MKSVLLIILILSCLPIKAQFLLQTTCATSTQGNAGNFVISYTIGEMVLVNTYKNNGLLITQGIAQPEVPNGIVNFNAFTSGDITVYPNPTPNQLSIQINILKQGEINLQLFDALGKLILSDVFAVNTFMNQKYNLEKYANGNFVLRLQFLSNDGVIDKRGSFKIVKIN